MRCLVAGAGGFIGGHLTRSLLDQDIQVIAADIKPLAEWEQVSPAATNRAGIDLREADSCESVMEGIDVVYDLSADMGGMGFVMNNKANCMLSVLIDTHLLLAARKYNVSRFFFASSACVYNHDNLRPGSASLRESDAYPANPLDGYGWQKLYSERMCKHFNEDFGLTTRIARFHTIYGPYGQWDGGREKAPAALCRKVIAAKARGEKEIEVWGDGEQTRSFTYISDCLTGIHKITDSAVDYPLNLGSSEMITINQLIDMIEGFAGTKLIRRYNLSAPIGDKERNSDNTAILGALGWEPRIPIMTGMELTYQWIHDEYAKWGIRR